MKHGKPLCALSSGHGAETLARTIYPRFPFAQRGFIRFDERKAGPNALAARCAFIRLIPTRFTHHYCRPSVWISNNLSYPHQREPRVGAYLDARSRIAAARGVRDDRNFLTCSRDGVRM